MKFLRNLKDRITQQIDAYAQQRGIFVPPALIDNPQQHYARYESWIQESVAAALGASWPIGPVELERAAALVFWHGPGKIQQPVRVDAYDKIVGILENLGLVEQYERRRVALVDDGRGTGAKVEIPVQHKTLREMLRNAEATRDAGALLVIAFNLEQGPQQFNCHVSMHRKAERTK
jgi:hypothetical protein